MGDLSKRETDTRYNQRAGSTKNGSDTTKRVESRNLTEESSGNENQTRKSTTVATGKEAGKQEGKTETTGTDKTVSHSTSERSSESKRDLTATAKAQVTQVQRVNIGLQISFRVPLHGKFPTESGNDSGAC